MPLIGCCCNKCKKCTSYVHHVIVLIPTCFVSAQKLQQLPIMAPRVSIEPSCHISTPSSDITCGVSGYLRIWGNLFSRRHVRLRVIISIPEKWKRMPHSIQPLQAKAIGSSRCRTSDFLSGDGKNMQKLNLPFPSDGCVKMAFRCPWFA